jgi:TrmH family RNA methyltransferase
MTDFQDLSARIRYVLVRTSHPGNIGSAARAIRTMGFGRMELVAPARFPDREANALAAGADDVLANAGIHADLVDSLAGSSLALGLSARRRGVNLPEISPREAAQQVLVAAARGEQVALVFGNERTGLENDELARCHAMVRIPSVEDFSSLNLSQAVQVMAYELRVAMLRRYPHRCARIRRPMQRRWSSSTGIWRRRWTRSNSTRDASPPRSCCACASCSSARSQTSANCACCTASSPMRSGWRGWRRAASRPCLGSLPCKQGRVGEGCF